MGKRPVDARGRLDDDPFDYRITKGGQVMISRGGSVVVTLGGSSAARLIARLETTDGRAQQLILAKTTGNYRHGNERSSGRH